MSQRSKQRAALHTHQVEVESSFELLQILLGEVKGSTEFLAEATKGKNVSFEVKGKASGRKVTTIIVIPVSQESIAKPNEPKFKVNQYKVDVLSALFIFGGVTYRHKRRFLTAFEQLGVCYAEVGRKRVKISLHQKP